MADTVAAQPAVAEGTPVPGPVADDLSAARRGTGYSPSGSRDQHGTVVEYVRAVHRGDRYRVESELVPPRLAIEEGAS